ncbi:unnamed protein product [Ambrosiozyma monospora]|uniref:Unnamed protein product n=1 Tax=Ambrosiozyma monospora TaxID=43982 RepID=A0A9W6WEQ5_AMBMO|nr:unnamed protein product [Ambrosiozyma monospora]
MSAELLLDIKLMPRVQKVLVARKSWYGNRKVLGIVAVAWAPNCEEIEEEFAWVSRERKLSDYLFHLLKFEKLFSKEKIRNNGDHWCNNQSWKCTMPVDAS